MRPREHRGGNAFFWLVAVGALDVAANASPQQAGKAAAGERARSHAATAASPRAALAVAYARSQLGKPYQWGAEGPGAFDCSGLTWASWRTAGLGWQRMTARDQWHALRAYAVSRRSEEHTSELQSRGHLVCRLLLEKKKNEVK